MLAPSRIDSRDSLVMDAMDSAPTGHMHTVATPSTRARAAAGGGWQIACCLFYLLCSAVALVCCLQSNGVLTFPAWPDDSFYYLSIGRSLALGRGPSADGIHLTTGFHPLWAALLGCAGRLVGTDRMSLLCTALGLQGVFAAGGWMLLWSTVPIRTRELRHGFLLFVIATLPNTVAALLCGMENTLAFFLLAAHLKLLTRACNAAGYFAAGALLAFAILARLDLACVTFGEIIALAYLCRLPRPRELVSLVLPGLLALAIWGLVSFALDGSVIPIHAYLKTRAWPEFHPRYPFVLPQLAWVAPLGLLIGFAIARRRRAGACGTDTLLLAVLVATALQVLHIMLYQRCWLGPWYATTIIVSSFLLVEACGRIDNLTTWRPRVTAWASKLTTVAAVALWLSQAVAVRASVSKAYKHAQSVEAAAAWLTDHAAGTVAACEDSGRLGFFAHNSVVNLDGLVNNRGYQRALQTVGLAGYLRQERVKYFVLIWPWRLPIEDRRLLWDGSYRTLDISLQQHKVYRDLGYPAAPLGLPREAERFRHVGRGAFPSFVWALND